MHRVTLVHTWLLMCVQGYIGDAEGYIGDTPGYIDDAQGFICAYRVT